MAPWPRTRRQYPSPRAPHAVLRHLDEITDELAPGPLALLSLRPRRQFFGRVHGDGFEVAWWPVDWHNAFVPIARGRVEEAASGSRVTISFRLPLLLEAGLAALIAVPLFAIAIKAMLGTLDWSTGLFAALTAAFAWLLVSFAFWKDFDAQQPAWRSLFDASGP